MEEFTDMKDEPTLDRFDLRTLEHMLRSGTITKKDYEAYLKKLPNSESNAEYVEIEEEQSTGDEASAGLTFAPVENQ
jgi:hypothetical protein